MARHAKPRRRIGSAKVIEEAPTTEIPPAPIVEHPDGFYWLAPDGKQQFGPFDTFELARADRDQFDDRAPEPGETVQEAERDIGIEDWIDPDTGAPAEGQSPPHLESE
jgi:hypothetical protein